MQRDDLTSRVQRLALRQQAATAEQSRSHRERFPEFAEYLDHLSRLAGGRCVVRYLHDEASGYTVGRQGDLGVVASVSRKPKP